MINTGGVLVASREVEEALFTHTAVSEVAVVGLPDDKWIEAVTAFVVLRAGHSGGRGRADRACATASRAVQAAEAGGVRRTSLPRNTAGKLLKRELRRQYGAGTAEPAAAEQ